MVKKNGWKVVVLAAVTAVFVGIVTFQSSGETEQLPVPRADSMEDVKQFQYQHVPGLERAEKLDLVKGYQIERPIPGLDRTLRIEEVWYNRRQAYIFYSIDYLPLKRSFKGQEHPSRLPSLSFTVSSPEKSQAEPTFSTGRGIFYNGRLYRYAQFDALESKNKDRSIESVILNKLKVLANGRSFPLQPIKLPVHYSAKQEVIKNISLDQTYQIYDDYSLTLDQFVIGTFGNKLRLHLNNPTPSGTLQGIELSIRTNEDNKEPSIRTVKKKKNQMEYLFPPFDQLPEKITIQVKGIRMVTHDYFRFSIEPGRFLDSNGKVEIGRKLAERRNTLIYLDQIRYDDENLEVQIRYKPTDPGKKQSVHLITGMPHFPRRDWIKDHDTPLLIEARNDEGRYAFSGTTGAGPGQVYRFALSPSFIADSRQIRVAIQNLPFVLPIHKELTFPVSK